MLKKKSLHLLLSGFFLSLFVTSACQVDRSLHIRRLLGWSPKHHLHLEVELLSVAQERPALHIKLWKHRTLLHQHVHHSEKIRTLANAYLQRDKGVETQLYALGHKLFAQHIQPKLKPAHRHLKETRFTSRKKRHLRQFKERIKLPQGAEILLKYEANTKEGKTSALFIQTLDQKAHWFVKNNIPSPQHAHILELTCRMGRCFVHIEHDSQRKNTPRSTYSFFFPLHKQAARLFNAHGYKLHDLRKFKKASVSFLLSTTLDPTYGDGMYNLACTYALRKLPQKAISTLKQAIKRDASFRKLACKDADFVSLFDTPFFLKTLKCKTKKKKKKPTKRRQKT